MNRPTPSRPAKGEGEHLPLADAFAGVLQSEAERRHEERRSRAPKGPSYAKPAFGLALLAALVWIWLAPPAWLRLPPLPSEPPEVQEAEARLALYLQAERILQFRIDRGRLPGTLAEAGDPLPGIRYEVLGSDRYRLRSTEPPLSYTSTDSPAALLAESVTRLRPGGAR